MFSDDEENENRGGRDELDELYRRHRKFLSGGYLENPWEEEDDENDPAQGCTGKRRFGE